MSGRLRALPFLLLVAAAAVAAPDTNAPRRRFALVVGANDGGPGRLLQHAISDARAFASVMRAMGGVAPGDIALLEDPLVGGIREALFTLRTRIEEARPKASAVELIFYYSGHSDEEGLLLHGEHLTYEALRQILKTEPADFRITVLDSCASGSFTRAKGGSSVAPFLVDRSSQVIGDAVLTSSSATEASQESDRLGGSFFTHHLLSGLRGAADVTHDGKVTLNEAYQFAFNETLARTERTRAGAQHPAYEMAVAGTGDVVMTDLRETTALLLVPDSMQGHLFIRNDAGRLVAELRKPLGAPVELGLEPGSYSVTLVESEHVYGGTITVTTTGPTVLDAAGLHRLPAEANPLRGEAAEMEALVADLRLWQRELRLFTGDPLSDAPGFSQSVTPPGLSPALGGSLFFRPLRNDRHTPLDLLRFFQRPDEISVAVGGLGLGSSFYFNPSVDLAAAVYPWRFLGFEGEVGFNYDTSYDDLGFRYGASVSYFPREDLRLRAGYQGGRGQSFFNPGTPYPQLTNAVANDSGFIEARWVPQRRWSLLLRYELARSMTRDLNQPGSQQVTPSHEVRLAVAYFIGRRLSIGGAARVVGAPVVSALPLVGVYGQQFELALMPTVSWYITDSLVLAGTLGPTYVLMNFFGSSPSGGWGADGSLLLAFRL